MESIVWNIGQKIGEPGGFGEVYEARCEQNGVLLKGSYALKKLKNLDAEAILRFRKEVEILKSLNHPKIVKVEGYNLLHEPYFYVMHRYNGSLARFIPQIIRDHSRIHKIFNMIFDGVEYFHKKGVCHRDLKPENILMNSDDELVISDFGLGLNLNSQSIRLTKTGQRMGTYLYMAPEQWTDGKHVDHRTDIYSLGRMIYECYTGPLQDFQTDLSLLPSGIGYVVGRCTKSKIEERFQTIQELRQAFNSALDILQNVNQVDDIPTILENIKAASYLLPEHIEQLISSFSTLDICNSPDLVHHFLMELPLNVIPQLEEIEPTLVGNLIEVFVNNITRKRWNFNYTDIIAEKCVSYYIKIKNWSIRAKLLYAILRLGVSHNRWYVMDIFEKLIYEIQSIDESYAILDMLNGHKILLSSLHLVPTKMNRVLRQLLD